MRLLLVATLACLPACGTSPDHGETPPRMSTGYFDHGDIRLSYRLDRPPGHGPFPAVVIGHGSGRTTKEACRPASVRFLERGFATLCYDKRGVGESSGAYASVGPANSVQMIAELADDMAAGVSFLRGQRDIDGTRIGLFGPSQAGWIVPPAAAAARARFMILVVGPTVSVGEEIFYSRMAEETTAPLEEAYRALPGFRGDRGFDPRPILETLDVPGLWLLGGEDRSIPTPRTVAILDELIALGRPFSRVVYPGLGHDLSGARIWDDIDRWLARTLTIPAPTRS